MKTLLLSFATVSALATTGLANPASAAPVSAVPGLTTGHTAIDQVNTRRAAPYKAPRRVAPKGGNPTLKRTH